MKNNQLIVAIRFKIASLKQALSYVEQMNLNSDQVDQLLDNLKALQDLLRVLESEK